MDIQRTGTRPLGPYTARQPVSADFFSDHSRRVRAELNARYNECPSPWGYQEFGPRRARLGPAALEPMIPSYGHGDIRDKMLLAQVMHAEPGQWLTLGHLGYWIEEIDDGSPKHQPRRPKA